MLIENTNAQYARGIPQYATLSHSVSDGSVVVVKPVVPVKKYGENGPNNNFSEKHLSEAIDKANEALSKANRRFEYSIHKETNSIMIKVIDNTTDEVVREIPSEKILDIVAKMCEMAGILIDERR